MVRRTRSGCNCSGAACSSVRMVCTPWCSEFDLDSIFKSICANESGVVAGWQFEELSLAHKPFDLERLVAAHATGIQLGLQSEPGKATATDKVDLHAIALVTGW